MLAIETNNLTKIFDNRLIAVNRVNLAIPEGSVFGLIGSNGAGKTTLLRMNLGRNRPSAGTVHVFGEPIGPNSAKLRQRIGFLAQSGIFPPHMTAIGFLDLVGRVFGVPRGERKARLSALIHAVDLLSASFQRVSTLSTGMKTRLGIAASLINDPDLLMWDEPTVGLDPTGRKYTLDLINAVKNEGKTVILSTHILPDADQACDQLGILNHGKVIFQGSVTELKRVVRGNVVGPCPAGRRGPAAPLPQGRGGAPPLRARGGRGHSRRLRRRSEPLHGLAAAARGGLPSRGGHPGTPNGGRDRGRLPEAPGGRSRAGLLTGLRG